MSVRMAGSSKSQAAIDVVEVRNYRRSDGGRVVERNNSRVFTVYSSINWERDTLEKFEAPHGLFTPSVACEISTIGSRRTGTRRIRLYVPSPAVGWFSEGLR